MQREQAHPMNTHLMNSCVVHIVRLTVRPMKRLHQIVGLVLMLLWVPITAHSTQENIPGLQFLQCATDADEKEGCEDDGCTQLESATYKISDTRTDFLPPAFTALFAFVAVEFRADKQRPGAIEVPPQIPCSWQFSCRTALPPRAPSFIS
jgi:hypothetical protein